MESDNVELLFENSSIAQIEEIEGKLMKEIEKKKDDLKQIIGEKYKDLIDVSDGLQVMDQRCLVVVEEIDHLDHSFSHFKSQVASAINNRQKVHESPVNKGNLLQWELAVKCKIIVKAPSKIWYYLDVNDILSATFHYSQVCFVWSKLKESFECMQNKRPNIVTQYADIVSNFSDILVNQAWSNTSYCIESTAEPESVALNLTCISILQSLGPSQLLEMFLEMRYHQLVQLFENNSSDFESICLNLFGNLFDTCQLAYLVFVDDMGIPNYLARSRDAVEKFQASHNLICNQQYLSLVPNYITNYRLRAPFTKLELEKSQVKEKCNNWIKRIQQNIIPRFSGVMHQVDSIVNLLTSLKGVNCLMNDSNRLLNWVDLNGILFDNGISIWHSFLQDIVMDAMTKLITMAVENAYASLQTSIESRLTKPTNESIDETAIDVVWESDSIEQTSLSLKAFALIERNISICLTFEERLRLLSDQLSILQDDASQAFIPSKDLVILQNVFTSKLVDYLDVFLSKFDPIRDQQSSDVLWMAAIYRTLVFGCSQFKSCHFLFTKDQSDWSRSRALLQNAYNNSFINFLSKQLIDLMNEFTSEMDVTSIIRFLDLCLNWEEITLEETAEDGKTIQSTIRVPMQVSIPLYSLLKQLSSTINNMGAHTMSRTVITTFLGKLGSELNSFYQQLLETIITRDAPKNVKHTQILQFYFDISFLDQLIALIKDDNGVKEVKCLVNENLNNYQNQIDPFDLHVLQPHLQSSVSRCLKSNGLILGSLIGQSTILPPPSSSHSTSTVKMDSKTDSPNPMPSYSLNFKFPILQKSRNKI